MPYKMIWVAQCGRCDHLWIPEERKRKPKRCAKCKSPYWDRPRVRAPRNASTQQPTTEPKPRPVWAPKSPDESAALVEQFMKGLPNARLQPD